MVPSHACLFFYFTRTAGLRGQAGRVPHPPSPPAPTRRPTTSVVKAEFPLIGRKGHSASITVSGQCTHQRLQQSSPGTTNSPQCRPWTTPCPLEHRMGGNWHNAAIPRRAITTPSPVAQPENLSTQCSTGVMAHCRASLLAAA
jgi:hypothetical protein